ncbi:MAG: RIP metalloprotease RseP [Phycisphaerae bacterium]
MLLGIAGGWALIAQTSGGWLSSAWYLLLVLLGFSVVVFFHELGHFMAAKWAKVRVERFAVGFGRELVGFTRGETRYSLNILPLGGYVKMLGQEDFAVDKSGELKVRDQPGSFTAKPVGKRMVIVSAGVIMNLLFAAIVFAAVTMVGRYNTPPIVGLVDPTSPAARAGMLTGDRILAVNGKAIRGFDDLAYRVALSDTGEELELTVERDGRIVEPRPRLLPEYRAEANVRQIGLGPALSPRVAVARDLLLGPGDESELRANDLLVKLGSGEAARPIRSVAEVTQALLAARGQPIDVVVQRPTVPVSLDTLVLSQAELPAKTVAVKATALWTLLPAEPPDAASGSLLGLVPRVGVVAVDANSPAELAGLKPGDVIVKVGTLSNPNMAELKSAVEASDDEDLPLVVRRPRPSYDGLPPALFNFLAQHREALAEAAIADPAGARALLEKLANAATLAPDDRAALTDHFAHFSSSFDWIRELDVFDQRELVVRPRSRFRLFAPRDPAAIGAKLAATEDDRVVTCDVVETVRGRISPARRAGIPRGATLVSVNQQPVIGWAGLTELFRGLAGKSVSLRYRTGATMHDAAFTVPESITTALQMPPSAVITAIAGQTSVELPGSEGAKPRRAVLPDWQAVEALLRRNLGSQVEVTYLRRDDGQSVTGSMAVTEENTDPWLMRVRYDASFLCLPRYEKVRVSNPFTALVEGVRRAYTETAKTYLSIKHIIFTREVGVENIRGPVGILRQGSQFAEAGFGDLLWFLGIISANLAVINFLPMPIVDGGLFIFLVLEKLRGEPVSIKTQVVTQLIGIALILSLFLFVTFQDIVNWNR